MLSLGVMNPKRTPWTWESCENAMTDLQWLQSFNFTKSIGYKSFLLSHETPTHHTPAARGIVAGRMQKRK
jgi:hypothetical protein